MPNILNQLYNGNGAINPELVETQPHLMKNVLKARRQRNKVSGKDVERVNDNLINNLNIFSSSG